MASRHRRPASSDAGYDDYDDYDDEDPYGRPQSKPRKRVADSRAFTRRDDRQRERRRATASKPFKCRQCKAFIGLPLTGGRQRNHCPSCLHSLHVDGKTPGDRASECRSLMAPAGAFFRPNGEQVLLHRCLGCGFERYNRVAADDNPLLVMRLPLVEARPGERQDEDEAIATA